MPLVLSLADLQRVFTRLHKSVVGCLYRATLKSDPLTDSTHKTLEAFVLDAFKGFLLLLMIVDCCSFRFVVVVLIVAISL